MHVPFTIPSQVFKRITYARPALKLWFCFLHLLKHTQVISLSTCRELTSCNAIKPFLTVLQFSSKLPQTNSSHGIAEQHMPSLLGESHHHRRLHLPTGANSNASVTASILFKCFYTNSTTEDGLLQTLPGLTSWGCPFRNCATPKLPVVCIWAILFWNHFAHFLCSPT